MDYVASWQFCALLLTGPVVVLSQHLMGRRALRQSPEAVARQDSLRQKQEALSSELDGLWDGAQEQLRRSGETPLVRPERQVPSINQHSGLSPNAK